MSRLFLYSYPVKPKIATIVYCRSPPVPSTKGFSHSKLIIKGTSPKKLSISHSS